MLLYVVEGTVRAAEPAPSGVLAGVELALATLFFAAASIHLLPFRRAARQRKAALAARREGLTPR